LGTVVPFMKVVLVAGVVVEAVDDVFPEKAEPPSD